MTYRFGPLERRGILGQLRAGQAAVVAAGAVLAIAILDREPTRAGGFLGGDRVDGVAGARVRAGRPPDARGVGADRPLLRCSAASPAD